MLCAVCIWHWEGPSLPISLMQNWLLVLSMQLLPQHCECTLCLIWQNALSWRWHGAQHWARQAAFVQQCCAGSNGSCRWSTPPWALMQSYRLCKTKLVWIDKLLNNINQQNNYLIYNNIHYCEIQLAVVLNLGKAWISRHQIDFKVCGHCPFSSWSWPPVWPCLVTWPCFGKRTSIFLCVGGDMSVLVACMTFWVGWMLVSLQVLA